MTVSVPVGRAQIAMLKKENEALRLKNGIYLHPDQWDALQSDLRCRPRIRRVGLQRPEVDSIIMQTRK